MSYRSLAKPKNITAKLISLMMGAASTSETSVNFYQTTRRYNPEDSHLHTLWDIVQNILPFSVVSENFLCQQSYVLSDMPKCSPRRLVFETRNERFLAPGQTVNLKNQI
jgi:hypothetical protein